MTKPRMIQPSPDEGGTPFQRFERLTRKLIAVPKKEIAQAEKKWQQRRKARP